MIDKQTAIKELNRNITFISSDYLSTHPATCDLLEENGAFNGYMCTAGEIVILLKETDSIKTAIKTLIDTEKNLLTHGLSDANDESDRKYIEGKISAYNKILEMID